MSTDLAPNESKLPTLQMLNIIRPKNTLPPFGKNIVPSSTVDFSSSISPNKPNQLSGNLFIRSKKNFLDSEVESRHPHTLQQLTKFHEESVQGMLSAYIRNEGSSLTIPKVKSRYTT